MLGVGRYFTRCLVAMALALPLAPGCGASKLEPCRTDGDCGAGERCDTSTARAEPIYGPCPYMSCERSSDCADGNVCRSRGEGSQPPCGTFLCLPPCDPGDATSCPANTFCRDDGRCTPLQCDESGGITCPEHWRCDPGSAENEPGLYTNTTFPVDGTSTVDPANPAEAVVHGCVRKRCHEDDGYACLFNYTCTPPGEIPAGVFGVEYATGCVATPCEELGACSDDERYICMPTSTAQRPGGTDANGCVLRNCEEGSLCSTEPSPWYFCDPSDLTADAWGCAVLPCTDGTPCSTGWICDPNGMYPDRKGCVRDPDFGAGGATGGGGNAGSSGSSSGGESPSTGGTAGGDAGTGGASPTGGVSSSSGGASGTSGGASGASGPSGTDNSGDGRCVER